MKIKELPSSIYHTWRLKSLSLNRLQKASSDTIPVVISLTSIPSRLDKIHIVIRCLLTQSKCPQKIVLWLHQSLEHEIPSSLNRLVGDVFEIRFSELDCPHLKLVESLRAFPKLPIITSDDDFIYEDQWVEHLYNEHIAHPNSVIANQLRRITYGTDGDLLPYKAWRYKHAEHQESQLLLPIGSKGVLYPPAVFDSVVLDDQLFLKLAPRADDLWFKAMSFLKGTPSRRIANPSSDFIPIIGTRKYTLATSNIKQDGNRTQWDALRNHFNFKTPDPKL